LPNDSKFAVTKKMKSFYYAIIFNDLLKYRRSAIFVIVFQTIYDTKKAQKQKTSLAFHALSLQLHSITAYTTLKKAQIMMLRIRPYRPRRQDTHNHRANLQRLFPELLRLPHLPQQGHTQTRKYHRCKSPYRLLHLLRLP